MQIELVSVGKPFVDGKFTKLEVEYIRDGKNSKAKLVGVGPTKAVIQSLQQFTSGDHVDVTLVKNGEFWNWTEVKALAGKAATEEKKTSYQVKSTYETPEERAIRQVYIARQNSVSNAVTLHVAKDGKPVVADVLATAQQLVDFVMEGTIPNKKSKRDDIPSGEIPF